FEHLAEGHIAASGPMFDLVNECHDRLATMVEQVTQGQSCRSAPDLIARIQALDVASTLSPTDSSNQHVFEPTMPVDENFESARGSAPAEFEQLPEAPAE